MSNIPTQLESPNGLHQRYIIKKILRKENVMSYFNGEPSLSSITITEEPVDKDAEYFVMRLDTGGSDIKHITACRIGIHAYADAIAEHLPQLAADLKSRYPLL
jgi:hypothetical protein